MNVIVLGSIPTRSALKFKLNVVLLIIFIFKGNFKNKSNINILCSVKIINKDIFWGKGFENRSIILIYLTF